VSYLGSEVTVASLKVGGCIMELLLFIDTTLSSEDSDICLFLLLILTNRYKMAI